MTFVLFVFAEQILITVCIGFINEINQSMHLSIDRSQYADLMQYFYYFRNYCHCAGHGLPLMTNIDLFSDKNYNDPFNLVLNYTVPKNEPCTPC